MSNLIGHEEWSNKPAHTQVYLATHDGADKRLPHRERSFISFTYGGKHIEDFSLIATINGDRMERQLYGEFNDLTSTYDVIDGQFYWGSHFNNNTLSLQLSTDEITEQKLQEFKAWFRPGPGKELILAEYPNRGIIARVSKAPEYHMLPFEKRVQQKFNNIIYEVSTTVYRGDINLEFIMDDPFWYSIYNVLPTYGQDGAEDWFKTLGINLTGDAAANSLMANKDYLKIILEDGVPAQEMFDNVTQLITGNIKNNVSTHPRVGGGNYSGTVVKVGDRLFSSSLIITSNNNLPSAYLYYAGNAPAPTALSFEITPQIDTVNGNYISNPLNKLYKQAYEKSTGTTVNWPNYNKIVVGKQEFQFTTPSIYTGYNQALSIISSCEIGESIVDIRIKLIEGVNEYYSRAFALGTLEYLAQNNVSVVDSTTSNIKGNFKQAFSLQMKKFLVGPSGNTISPATFTFDSKTGIATGTFNIYEYDDNLDVVSSGTHQENVGDMIYNKYLYLDETNRYNDVGKITTEECTPISTDYPTALNNFDIQYKHMYL